MEFKIGNKINPVVNPTNTYRFEISYMHGDAEHYDDETVDMHKDNPYLEKFVNFLDACDAYYPRGKGGMSDYQHVKGGDLFLEGAHIKDEDRESIEELWDDENLPGICIPYDDHGCCSSFDGYSVTYFDENGIQYHIEIMK